MGAQAVRLSNVDINNALENKDFEVLFQPIFDLGNGALARMETFVRWRHPTLGVLPPGAFISFFESQGRMGELTRYILDVALDSYSEWRGPYAPGFSINLALADLTDEAFAPHFTKQLRDRDFPADLVTLECPMPAVDSDIENMIDCFDRLRETGARLAIEVRGRANDFLRTVDPFPFDEIKTGGSSILRFARTVRGPGLSAISDLLDIAGKANAVTTAVGVEDQASLSALKGLGFTAAQGNHLAKVGALKDFRPNRVNDVRALLDLQPLSGDDLSALFRTSAPAPKAADDPSTAQDAEPAAETASDNTDAGAEKSDADQQALAVRARKKARAAALAKRAKARDARKAAAIKRAKAKVALSRDDTAPDETDAAPPRALQDRLSAEFGPTDAEDAVALASEPADEIKASIVEEDSHPPADADVSLETVDGPLEKEDAPELATEAPAPVAETATAEMSDQPAPAPAEDSVQLNLPIGETRAHFRPGIRVGGPPTSVGETQAQPLTGDAVPTHAPPQFQAAADAAAPEEFSAAPETKPAGEELEAPSLRPGPSTSDLAWDEPADDEPEAEPKSDPTPPAAAPADPVAPPSDEQTVEQGTLYESDEVVSAPARPQRRKNFLTRRYQVVPNHFWPKSWKKAWARRRAARAIDDF